MKGDDAMTDSYDDISYAKALEGVEVLEQWLDDHQTGRVELSGGRLAQAKELVRDVAVLVGLDPSDYFNF